MPARVFLQDYHPHRRGEVLNLPTINSWRSAFGEKWMTLTAPVGSRMALELQDRLTSRREDERRGKRAEALRRSFRQ